MLSNLLGLLILSMAPAPQGGPGSVRALESPRLAQQFTVESDDARPKKARPKKKKKKPKEIKTEEDLWSAPEEDPGGKDDDPGVEEVDPDEIEDIDEKGDKTKSDEPTPEGGGWGADVERDNWGDEHRIDNAPLDQGEPDELPAAKPKPDAGTKAPDGGRGQAETKPGPGEEPPDGGADPKPATEGDKPEPGEEVLTDLTSEQILAPSGTVADLELIWEKRRVHLDQRDFALASKDLDRFVKLSRELRIGNLYPQANVLIREADRAAKAENDQLAERLLNTAVELAPDMPNAYLARTSFWFFDSPYKVGRLLEGLTDSAQAAFRNPLNKNRILVNALITVLLGLSLVVVVFSIVQLLHYLKLFLHDFHHLFPRGVALFQTGILGVLLVLTPVFFRAGLVAILLTWLLIAWIYQSWRERSVTIVALLFLAAAPFVLQFAIRSMHLPDTRAGDLVAVVHESAPEHSVRKLKAELQEQPSNHVILAALGSYYKRIGRLDEAKNYYELAIALAPNSEILLNNLGNVLFLQADLKGALERYKRATITRPDLVVPYFNLSRAYYRSANLDKGKESGNQAIRMDQVAVRALRKQADSGMANYVVADIPLPNDWLLQNGHPSQARLDRTVESVWRALAGSRSLRVFWFTGAGALVLFILMFVLRQRVFGSNGCVRCGRPACRRCTPELHDDSICGQCYHAFVKKSQVDAKSRISKEIQIRQYRRRIESIARGITFVLPGVGQLLKGRTLRGILFLLVFGLVLSQVLLSEQVMRDPYSMGSTRSWLVLVPQLVVFAGFYVWAILDAFRAD